MDELIADRVLTPDGWRRNVAVTVKDGAIQSVEPTDKRATVGVLLPAPTNCHSHTFQRAMAGLTERAGVGTDDFWSWRALMYAFLDRLGPDDVEAIAAGAMMEMLEAGYAAVGEFHYLHHGVGGTPYANPAELCERIAAAASTAGIGLTLLPVLYCQGGLDGRPLEGGQRRFGNDLDGFARLMDGARAAVAALRDARIGFAPHSLRAVPDYAFGAFAAFDGPHHVHVAEQLREDAEVRAATGLSPVATLAKWVSLGPSWTLVHATHASADEMRMVADAGATVGFCPVTEANLGDGIAEVPAFLTAGGQFAVGTDSNVLISVAQELRTLDYAQRLRLHRRNPLVTCPGSSSGRLVFEGAAAGGSRSIGRNAGRIAPGALADLLSLDTTHPALQGLEEDRILDAFVFSGGDVVRDVWSAGRHVVRHGRHVSREVIAPRFEACLRRLRAAVL